LVTLDFTDFPVVDNHCHPMDPKKDVLDPGLLAHEFYHGFGDIPEDGISGRQWGATDELSRHLLYMGARADRLRERNGTILGLALRWEGDFMTFIGTIHV
jgi:hypothetical protein